MRTPTKEFKFDLIGKAHYDKAVKAWTQTPHIHMGKLNMKAPSNLGRKFNYDTDATPMTDENIRLIRKYIDSL